MLDPRNWKYVDRLRLLIAVTFGAALGCAQVARPRPRPESAAATR